MTKKLVMLFIVLMFCAMPMFAQGAAATATGGDNMVPLAAGLSMAIAAGLGAIGMGRATAGAVEGLARNPGAAKVIQANMILGLVFMESLALYTIVIIFVKVK